MFTYKNPQGNTTTGTDNGTPSPIYPYINLLTNTERPNFIWHTVTNADSYNLKVGEIFHNGADTVPVININLTDTFYIPGNSLSTGEYTWQVASYLDTGGISHYSSNIYFRIDLDSPIITSVSPTDYTNENAPAIIAHYMDVFSGILTNSCILILDNDTVTATVTTDSIYFIPTYTLTEGIHYVKVIAKDSASNSSEYTWSFEVDNIPPSAPVLLYPNNGDTVDTSIITFIWSSSTLKSPVYYNYQCSIDSSFTYTLIDSIITDTTLILSSLPLGTYYWRVIAKDAAGNSSNPSIIYEFVISPSQIIERPSGVSIMYKNSKVVFEFSDVSAKSPAHLLIFDRSGREVFSTDIRVTPFIYKWQNNYNRKLPSGIYYYKVIISKEKYYGKLIHYN